MKLKYLGTAAAEGWPALFCQCPTCKAAKKAGGKNIRTRSQAVIDNQLLLDFCQDTYLHALKYDLDLSVIKSLFVTHSHPDHFYPMDLLLRAKPYADCGMEHLLTVYGNKEVKKLYERMRREEDDSENLDLCVANEVIHAFDEIVIEGYHITALPAKHMMDEQCLLYLIGSDDGSTLLYAHDTAMFPEVTWEYLKGWHLDMVSLDCTMGLSADGDTHMGLSGCRECKNRLIKQGSASCNTDFVLNHFSHNGGILHEEMEELVKEDGFAVAYDGLEVNIQRIGGGKIEN